MDKSEIIKKELLKKLKQVKVSPFLFVGSGISRRYLNLENWNELLDKFSKKATGNEFQYQVYVNDIIGTPQYGKEPKIAEMLERDFSKVYLTKDEFEEERTINKDKIKEGISPFKIALADHFKDIQIDETDNEIKLLRKLAVRNIAGIITTNYDEFIEKIFAGYKTYIGQEELIFSTIYETGEIYKIHGCCNKPGSIVITEKDYAEFIRKNDYLTAKLLTIFLEHPIIFIGYSISDRNIQNILESIANCLSQENLNILKERLIFIEWTSNKYEIDISSHSIKFSNKNNIKMTKITINDFNTIYEILLENKSKYNPKVLRSLKKDIYELVRSDSPKEKIKVVGLEESNNYSEIEVVMGVGILTDYGKKGYSSIKANEIYEDIILNNKHYDIDKIVKETLPDLLKANPKGIPVYKYLKGYSDNTPEIFSEFKNKGYNDFLNKSIRERKKHQRNKILEKNIDWIVEKGSFPRPFEMIAYLEEDEITLEQLEKYLKKLIQEKPKLFKEHPYKSDIKRIARIYDYLKYKD